MLIDLTKMTACGNLTHDPLGFPPVSSYIMILVTMVSVLGSLPL